jgi:hypothetical protein
MPQRRTRALFAPLRPAAVAVLAALLSGCAAVAVVPAVSLANGARDDKINITLDEGSFTPELRSTLQHGKHMALAVTDGWAIKLADLMEARGGYVLTIERPKAKITEMTATERRDTLKGMCSGPKPQDVAMLGRINRVDISNASVATVTGRTSIKNNWTLELLACHSHRSYSFGGGFDLDVSTANAKSTGDLDEKMGLALAEKVLSALGK